MSTHPADTYLRLAEGPDDLLSNQVSLTRRLLTLCVAVVLFTGTSLYAAAAFDLTGGAFADKAIASPGSGKDGDDGEDHSGPGGGDDDDDSDTIEHGQHQHAHA